MVRELKISYQFENSKTIKVLRFPSEATPEIAVQRLEENPASSDFGLEKNQRVVFIFNEISNRKSHLK